MRFGEVPGAWLGGVAGLTLPGAFEGAQSKWDAFRAAQGPAAEELVKQDQRRNEAYRRERGIGTLEEMLSRQEELRGQGLATAGSVDTLRTRLGELKAAQAAYEASTVPRRTQEFWESPRAAGESPRAAGESPRAAGESPSGQGAAGEGERGAFVCGVYFWGGPRVSGVRGLGGALFGFLGGGRGRWGCGWAA